MSEHTPSSEDPPDSGVAPAHYPAETAPQATAVRPEIPVKERFSHEYVAELRAESEAWQQKHQKALAELNQIKQDTQQQLTQTQHATRARILRAELKALAMKAGLRDLDDLKLADLSTVTLKDDDTLDGAAEMLAALKEAKPYLFTAPTLHTRPPEPPPAPKAAETNVSQLPADEYVRSKHAYLNGA